MCIMNINKVTLKIGFRGNFHQCAFSVTKISISRLLMKILTSFKYIIYAWNPFNGNNTYFIVIWYEMFVWQVKSGPPTPKFHYFHKFWQQYWIFTYNYYKNDTFDSFIVFRVLENMGIDTIIIFVSWILTKLPSKSGFHEIFTGACFP